MAYAVIASVVMILIKRYSPPSQTEIRTNDSVEDTIFFRLLDFGLSHLPIRLRFGDAPGRFSLIIHLEKLAMALVLAILACMVSREGRMAARMRGGRA
jgi:hypothetical protein